MNAQLSMFPETTCAGSDSAISSPGSADGRTRSASLDGKTTARSGLGHARVSRFRALESDSAMSTNDTSGPLFSASSPSAALQFCLENKLRERMDVNGSPECELIWRHWDMPAGPPICALRASARRTSASASTGAPWSTPTEQDSSNNAGPSQFVRNSHPLNVQATLHMWPTPTAQTANGEPEAFLERKRRSIARGSTMGVSLTDLNMVAKASVWPTPAVADIEGGRKARSGTRSGELLLNGLAHGRTANGGAAPTARRGALNPGFVCWLMGYPAAWEDCADMATQWSRRLRKRSSRL